MLEVAVFQRLVIVAFLSCHGQIMLHQRLYLPSHHLLEPTPAGGLDRMSYILHKVLKAAEILKRGFVAGVISVVIVTTNIVSQLLFDCCVDRIVELLATQCSSIFKTPV